MADKIKVDRDVRSAFSFDVRRPEKGSIFLYIFREILIVLWNQFGCERPNVSKLFASKVPLSFGRNFNV